MNIATSTSQPQNLLLDAVVVGAGPSGLILAKALAEAGVSFRVYERNADVGGVWNIDAENTPMYESAHFISSKTLSGFEGFPMPDDYPDYPSHQQIFDYICHFADAHQLRQHIQFNTAINKASQDEQGRWHIELGNGDKVQANYLICANGVTWEPNQVSFNGNFNGEIRHSVTYRRAEEFTGKRVLIVGAGNSGVDIACDAAFSAKQAYLSLRRGYHFIPKHIMGKPTDLFAHLGPKLPFVVEQKLFGGLLRFINGDLQQYGLPKPDHKVFQTHPIMNTQILHYLAHGDCIAKPDVAKLDGDMVEFKDGSREQIDVIIMATGYQHAVPFLDDGVIAFKHGRPDLYMNMFSRQHDNLAVLGFIEFASAAYQNFAKMAELIVADVLKKPTKLAELKKSHRPDLTGGHGYLATKRNANYVDVDTYLKQLKKVKQQIGMMV